MLEGGSVLANKPTDDGRNIVPKLRYHFEPGQQGFEPAEIILDKSDYRKEDLDRLLEVRNSLLSFVNSLNNRLKAEKEVYEKITSGSADGYTEPEIFTYLGEDGQIELKITDLSELDVNGPNFVRNFEDSAKATISLISEFANEGYFDDDYSNNLVNRLDVRTALERLNKIVIESLDLLKKNSVLKESADEQNKAEIGAAHEEGVNGPESDSADLQPIQEKPNLIQEKAFLARLGRLESTLDFADLGYQNGLGNIKESQVYAQLVDSGLLDSAKKIVTDYIQKFESGDATSPSKTSEVILSLKNIIVSLEAANYTDELSKKYLSLTEVASNKESLKRILSKIEAKKSANKA